MVLESLDVSIKTGRKEGNVLFNDTLYLRLYGIKDHSDSERRNLLSPHGLLFLISSKGSFICTDRIAHTTAFVNQLWSTGWNAIKTETYAYKHFSKTNKRHMPFFWLKSLNITGGFYICHIHRTSLWFVRKVGGGGVTFFPQVIYIKIMLVSKMLVPWQI